MDLRFDDAYEKVYELNVEENAYFFVGNYFAFGIDKDMSVSEKQNIVEMDSSRHRPD